MQCTHTSLSCGGRLTLTALAGAQRTIRAAYTFPAEVLVSAECRDLISRIFQADPDKRATVEDIRGHPWFLKDLPPELAVRRVPGGCCSGHEYNDLLEQLGQAGSRGGVWQASSMSRA